MVVVDNRVLGKPRDREEAIAMLLALQGRTHEVMTGVWVCAPQRAAGFVDRTQVAFYPMTRAEAAVYVDTGEPMDKAGAYGVQGQGALLVEGIRGDFYNVMGLPVLRLSRMLARFGVTFFD